MASIYMTAKSQDIRRRLHISAAEKRYLEDGVLQDFRNDGRSCLDHRPFSVEYNIIPSASGSARLTGIGTDIIIGVKCELERCDNSAVVSLGSSQRLVQIHVDCAASVSRHYDGRGDEFCSSLARQIEAYCLNKSVVSRNMLCDVSGKLQWLVYVDVMVLSSGGNLLDMISLGVKAALSDTVIPKVHVQIDTKEVNAEQQSDDEVDALHYDVDERPEAGTRFECGAIPLLVTAGQIGGRLLWDISSEEESCVGATATVAVDRAGRCFGITTSGFACIDMSALPNIIEGSRQKGVWLHNKLQRHHTLSC